MKKGGSIFPDLYPSFAFGYAEPSSAWRIYKSASVAIKELLSALFLRYKDAMLVVPAYVCADVINVINEISVAHVYVDLDDSLDMDLNALQDVHLQYREKTIIILGVAIFGVHLRDYKKLFPNSIVIEDRSQGLLRESSTADYQITSVNKGKLTTCFGGGILMSKSIDELDLPPARCRQNLAQFYLHVVFSWLQTRSYLVNLVYKGMFPLVRFMINNRNRKLETCGVSRKKERWIAFSLANVTHSERSNRVSRLMAMIPSSYQYDLLPAQPLLRFPVKSALHSLAVLPGVMLGSIYADSVSFAERHMNVVFPKSRELCQAVLLPTHALLNEKWFSQLRELLSSGAPL